MLKIIVRLQIITLFSNVEIEIQFFFRQYLVTFEGSFLVS